MEFGSRKQYLFPLQRLVIGVFSEFCLHLFMCQTGHGLQEEKRQLCNVCFFCGPNQEVLCTEVLWYSVGRMYIGITCGSIGLARLCNQQVCISYLVGQGDMDLLWIATSSLFVTMSCASSNVVEDSKKVFVHKRFHVFAFYNF